MYIKHEQLESQQSYSQQGNYGFPRMEPLDLEPTEEEIICSYCLEEEITEEEYACKTCVASQKELEGYDG